MRKDANIKRILGREEVDEGSSGMEEGWMEKRQEQRGRTRRELGILFRWILKPHKSLNSKTLTRKLAYFIIPCSSKIDDDKLRVYFPSEFVCFWRWLAIIESSTRRLVCETVRLMLRRRQRECRELIRYGAERLGWTARSRCRCYCWDHRDNSGKMSRLCTCCGILLSL